MAFLLVSWRALPSPPRGAERNARAFRGGCHCEAMTDEGDRAERDGSDRSTRGGKAQPPKCGERPAPHGAISLSSIPLIRPNRAFEERPSWPNRAFEERPSFDG